MSRKRNQVNGSVVEALRNQVRLKSNLECSSFADMQQLQHEIRKPMNESLSLQTLNRFFGIIKNDFSPSLNTLNILSQYLQYKSFREFSEFNGKPGLIKKLASFESKFIFSVFSSVDPNQDDGQVLQTVIRNILNIINDDTQMAAGLYPAMASIPFGRRYFFERNVNMDSLAKLFGDSLSYYLLYAGSREEQFFAYSLYCLRYFLTGELDLFNQYFAHLNGFFLKEDIDTWQPQHIGSYYAMLILNQSITDDPIDKTAVDSVLGNSHIPFTGNAALVNQACYLVIQALVLTGEFEKAWEKLNEWLLPRLTAQYMATDAATNVNLLRLLCGYYSGNIPFLKARQLFSELNVAQFHTTVRDYFSILLLLLKKSLFPKALTNKETDAKIQRLITRTGFVYFRNYLTILKNIDENNLMDINGKKRH